MEIQELIKHVDMNHPQYTISAKGLTDIGAVRAVNQDAIYIGVDENLFIVADGMGGHAGGEIASQKAIEEIKNHLVSAKNNNTLGNLSIPEKITNAINHASSKIFEFSLDNPELRGMGTTVTLVYKSGNHLYLGHVGDSRCYLVRSGFLYQITDDHSLVSEQLRAGRITPEEARKHKLKNIITRSVGYKKEENIDVSSFRLHENDFFILCSDGLHGKVSEIEMLNIIKEQKLDSSQNLVERAIQHGGDDNISVIVAQISAKNNS